MRGGTAFRLGFKSCRAHFFRHFGLITGVFFYLLAMLLSPDMWFAYLKDSI